jgi:hypothetical protein
MISEGCPHALEGEEMAFRERSNRLIRLHLPSILTAALVGITVEALGLGFQAALIAAVTCQVVVVGLLLPRTQR